MDNIDRFKIFVDTVAIAAKGKYVNSNGAIVTLKKNNENGLSIDDCELYNKDLTSSISFSTIPRFSKCEIRVENNDTLLVAKELIDNLFNPAVLNMASFIRPGGGVLKGSSAQEENLFRRTNLSESLFRFQKDYAQQYNLPVSAKQYPLDLRYGGIYSPAISVFRGTEKDGYPLLNTPFMVDVISVAAIKNPILIDDGKLSERDREITRNKIRTILNIAIYWGNDSLVLGALGCGAYGTPPYEMASLFKEVLNEDNYQNRFRTIVFAIIDDGNAHRKHNPNGNFIPFKEVFESA